MLLALSAAVSLASGVVAAPPVAASPSAIQAPPQAGHPTQAEARAFIEAYSPGDLRRENELRLLRQDFIPALERNPETAAMLKAFPALGPALIEALAQHIDLYMTEYNERFYPRATALVTGKLSSEDVGALTAFYHSELGQKVLRAASAHVSAGEIADAGLEGKSISPEMAMRQVMIAGWGGLAELTPTERNAVMAFAMSPPGQHLQTIFPDLLALQAELANSPGPRFEAASEKSMSDAFQRITGISLHKTGGQ